MTHLPIGMFWCEDRLKFIDLWVEASVGVPDCDS